MNDIEGDEEEEADTPSSTVSTRHQEEESTRSGGRDRSPMSPWNYEGKVITASLSQVILTSLPCFSTDEEKWGRRFPACDGSSQSPININPKQITEEASLSIDFLPSYSSKMTEVMVVNTGMTRKFVGCVMQSNLIVRTYFHS